MKRILIALAAAALLAGCSEDRSTVLKVYNWSDYIDETVIPEFEQWYKEQTGETVHGHGLRAMNHGKICCTCSRRVL